MENVSVALEVPLSVVPGCVLLVDFQCNPRRNVH